MKTATGVLDRTQSPAWWIEAALVVGASCFVALCARVTVPLPFTPVPLTLQNFAVLLVGLALGSRRGFAALALYLAEGAFGLPVFNPTGLGGIAQLLGPTGGYLMAYPLVAFVSGWIAERGSKSFRRFAVAAVLGEVLLFAGGLEWLSVWTHGSWWQAAHFGLYPFVFAEVVKVMAAAGLATRWPARATQASDSNLG
jgi:biotin transport system substrate-specific component